MGGIALIALLWAVGIAVGCWRMLGRFEKGDGLYFSICLLISLGLLLPGKGEDTSAYAPSIHMPQAYGVFIFMFAMLFRDRIAALIDERVILVWTLLALYVGVELFGPTHPLFFVFACVAALVIVLAACPWSFPQWLRIAMYIWFMFCASMIGILQIRAADFRPFFDYASISPLSFPGAFMSGMALLMTGAHVSHLFFFIPVPGKHQSFTDRLEEVREHALFFGKRYAATQAEIWWHTTMIILLGGFLLGNTLWHLVPVFLLVNAIIILMPFIIALAPVRQKSQ